MPRTASSSGTDSICNLPSQGRLKKEGSPPKSGPQENKVISKTRLEINTHTQRQTHSHIQTYTFIGNIKRKKKHKKIEGTRTLARRD